MAPYDASRHGPKRIVGPGFHGQVHAVVRTIPEGSVATYGDIGAVLGSKSVARQVGYAMAALPEGNDVPWWRVVGAGGRLSQMPGAAERQARHLEAEGIEVGNLKVQNFAERRHVFSASEEASN